MLLANYVLHLFIYYFFNLKGFLDSDIAVIGCWVHFSTLSHNNHNGSKPHGYLSSFLSFLLIWKVVNTNLTADAARHQENCWLTTRRQGPWQLSVSRVAQFKFINVKMSFSSTVFYLLLLSQ